MPRFLAPNARAGDGRGYLTAPLRPLQPGDSEQTVSRIAEARSMCDEPEALDTADWKRHIEPRSDQTEKQRRTVEEIARDRAKQLLSQEERLRAAQAEAAVKRRDVSRETWVIDQMLAKGRTPELIEKRLQGIERIAYLGRAA